MNHSIQKDDVVNNTTSLHTKDFSMNRFSYIGGSIINPSWMVRKEYTYTHTYIYDLQYYSMYMN